jgi:hypothetical protein
MPEDMQVKARTNQCIRNGSLNGIKIKEYDGFCSMAHNLKGA